MENSNRTQNIKKFLYELYGLTDSEVVSIYSYLKAMSRYLSNHPNVNPDGCFGRGLYGDENDSSIDHISKMTNNAWNVFTLSIHGGKKGRTVHQNIDSALDYVINRGPFEYDDMNETFDDDIILKDIEELYSLNKSELKKHRRQVEATGDMSKMYSAVYELIALDHGYIKKFIDNKILEKTKAQSK